ncbi:hypothetical protein WG947_11935 [Pontibacter sp. H259]|uniref:hypothetical protein n=1 Tax=Pontibacter sp. H259 TaxID=3133421 RepID=UPI0030C00403
MGFNISGVAINKNYKDNWQELQNKFGWTLKKKADISFEEAAANWKDEGICDVYFSEKGTLMFISIDRCLESWALKDADTLTFALSETSMAFNLNYCEKGEVERSIMEVNGDRMTDEGERLEAEDRSEDISDLIFNQMAVVLGKSFWSIEPGESAERYVFVQEAPSYPASEPELTVAGLESPQFESSVTSASKKWWQFWK